MLSRLGAFFRRRPRSGNAPVLLSQQPAVAVDHPLRPSLDARYLAMREAMASGDADRIVAFFTTDYIGEELEGRRKTARETANEVLALVIDRSQRTVETRITDIVLVGDEATLRQRYRMTTTERSMTVPEALWTEAETEWRRVGNEWLCARATTIAMEFIRDGRRRFRRRLDPHDPSVIAELEGPAGA